MLETFSDHLSLTSYYPEVNLLCNVLSIPALQMKFDDLSKVGRLLKTNIEQNTDKSLKYLLLKYLRKTCRRVRACPLGKFWILKCHFLHFWEVILQNCEDYKTSYKIHKRHHISGLWIYIEFFFILIFILINYKILFKKFESLLTIPSFHLSSFLLFTKLGLFRWVGLKRKLS